MYRLHEYWVNAYLKDIFYAGMITNQRSESINSFFDIFVNENTKLVEFVYQYNKAVTARRSSETQQDFWGLNSVLNCTSNSYEIQVQSCIPRRFFNCFKRNR